MAASSSRHTGIWIVLSLFVLSCAAAFYIYTRQSQSNPLAHLASTVPILSTLNTFTAPTSTPPAPVMPEATSTLKLADLTPADIPATVTLLKPEQIRFRKGGTFVAKGGAPLLFEKLYLRDAKPGEQFQILDYNPADRHIFLRAVDPYGKIIAINTLDLHGTGKDPESLPPNTTVSLQGVTDGNALVTYQGDRFVVPVDDTDLLSQAAIRRQSRGGN
jgi:hypothetical protein